MRTSQISKNQYLITLTPSELLIMEAYADVFHVTMQDSALIMCVHGWNSYAKLMTQYSKNCRMNASSAKAAQLLENHQKLIANSDEAHLFNDAMQSARQLFRESENGNPDSMAR